MYKLSDLDILNQKKKERNQDNIEMAWSDQFVANSLLLAFLGVGTITSLVFKEQSNCSSQGHSFNHPFMQSMTMYVGEALCLCFYWGYIRMYPTQYEEGKAKALTQGKQIKINPLLLIIPTSCDFVTSTLTFFALEMMPASLYSMIRSGNLVVTTIFSVVFLKRKLYSHHYLGLTTIVCGLIAVGIIVIQHSQSSGDDTSKMYFGIILLFTSFFTFSAQLIIEEKFFHQYHLNPFQTVGLEGIWGVLICGAAISLFNYVPCPSNMSDDCPPNGNLEDISFFFKQVFTFEGQDQPTLVIMVLLGIILILFFNAISLSITKYVSSLARNVAQVLSPFFVWMASLALQWQSFLWGQLLGFLVIALGTCIFNEIIVIPFYGLDQNTKKALLAKKKASFIISPDDSKESEALLLSEDEQEEENINHSRV